jgi:Xaa-Pro aminopeptidase
VTALLLLAFGLLAQDAPPPITAQEFAARRAALAGRFDGEVVIIPAEPLGSGMEAIDTNTPLLDFTYLVGAQPEGAVLVLDGTTAVLFSPEPAGGIERCFPVEEFDDFVRAVFRQGDRVRLWTLRRGRSRRIAELLAEHGVGTLGGVNAALTELRVRKSQAELALIRRASAATNAAHRDVRAALRPGMNERELQEIIERRFRQEGCARNAFPCIVGSGPNSVILHYAENRRQMQEGEVVVVDIGAECHGYATDITRTYPVAGRFTDRQREIYQIVRDAQTAAEQALRPGATLTDVDAAARRVIAGRGYGRFFVHHTSHYVGLSVHDSGSYRAPLPAGAVVVIEPGIYLPEEGFGIRIEDIYVVTETGWERLSEGAPREIAEIERHD